MRRNNQSGKVIGQSGSFSGECPPLNQPDTNRPPLFMSSDTTEDWPLEVTPFEAYLLADDRADYPMTFLFRLEFSGQIEPESWERSLVRALERHPLLWARVHRKWGRWWWLAPTRHDLARVALVWDQAPDAAHAPPLNLRSGPGVRFWLERSGDQIRLTGEFHHACCDGVGALQFFGDWLAAYAAELSSEPHLVAWDPLEPSRLATRGAVRWRQPPRKVSASQALRGFCKEAWLWLRRRPRPLATSTDARSSRGEAPRRAFAEILSETFSQDETVRLRQVARHRGATVNDLLLCELFGTLAQWNDQHRNREPGWLVVTMPTNLRQPSDSALPAANVIGYAFVARRIADARRSDELLSGLTEETKAIRTERLGNYFLEGLTWAQRIPGVLDWTTRRSVCQATAVFSNLGDPQRRMNSRLPRVDRKVRAGALVLQRVLAVPPLRPKTHAVFLASQSADQLTLCLSYDAHRLTAEAGSRLLGSWVERIRGASRSASILGNGFQQIQPLDDASGEPSCHDGDQPATDEITDQQRQRN
jgi:hypothetical protein